MANPKPTHQWKKGAPTANPKGRPRLSPDIAKLKETSYSEFITQLHDYGSMTPLELREEHNKKDIKVFQKIFSRLLLDAMEGEEDVCNKARQLLFERLWGKVRDQTKIPVDPQREYIQNLTTLELVDMAKDTIGIEK